jgi:hypothetical protein
VALPKPSSLRKRCVRDMLTKPLNRAHAQAGISEDPRVEMSDPRMNSPERPDEPMTLGIGRGIDKNAFDPASGHEKLLHLNL